MPPRRGAKRSVSERVAGETKDEEVRPLRRSSRVTGGRRLEPFDIRTHLSGENNPFDFILAMLRIVGPNLDDVNNKDAVRRNVINVILTDDFQKEEMKYLTKYRGAMVTKRRRVAKPRVTAAEERKIQTAAEAFHVRALMASMKALGKEGGRTPEEVEVLAEREAADAKTEFIEQERKAVLEKKAAKASGASSGSCPELVDVMMTLIRSVGESGVRKEDLVRFCKLVLETEEHKRWAPLLMDMDAVMFNLMPEAKADVLEYVERVLATWRASAVKKLVADHVADIRDGIDHDEDDVEEEEGEDGEDDDDDDDEEEDDDGEGDDDDKAFIDEEEDDSRGDDEYVPDDDEEDDDAEFDSAVTEEDD